MITRRTSRAHSVELGLRTILFSMSGCASSSAYAQSYFRFISSAILDDLSTRRFRRCQLDIGSSTPFFYILPTKRIESDTLDHRQRLSPLCSLRYTRLSSRHLLFLFLSLYIVTPSDKPLSLPLGQNRRTAHFDVRPVLKSEKRKKKARRREMRAREQTGTTNSRRENDVKPYDR